MRQAAFFVEKTETSVLCFQPRWQMYTVCVFYASLMLSSEQLVLSGGLRHEDLTEPLRNIPEILPFTLYTF